MSKITKSIVVKAETLHKMKKLVSLFDDEISTDAKEPEIIGYFLEKGFEALVESGEIDRRVKAVLGIAFHSSWEDDLLIQGQEKVTH